MQTSFLLGGIGALLLTAHAVAKEPEGKCPEGELVQWVADYCMLMAETDDEIAASECINKEIGTAFSTACIGKRHFKRAMCKLFVAKDAARGPVERCLEDPGFMGRTVRNKGAGV